MHGRFAARAAAIIALLFASPAASIRNARLAGFTADRLMGILHKLHRSVHVIVSSPGAGHELQQPPPLSAC